MSETEIVGGVKKDPDAGNADKEASAQLRLYFDEFAKETDRAAVIITSAIFEENLRNLLKLRLAPVSSGTDELFEGGNAPLGTLSAKIAMAYRLGMISAAFSRSLHLVKKTRNDFAHNFHGGSFDDSAVKGRVYELYRSQKHRVEHYPDLLEGVPETRAQFMTACGWMIWTIKMDAAKIIPIREAPLEFGYVWSLED